MIRLKIKGSAGGDLSKLCIDKDKGLPWRSLRTPQKETLKTKKVLNPLTYLLYEKKQL